MFMEIDAGLIRVSHERECLSVFCSALRTGCPQEPAEGLFSARDTPVLGMISSLIFWYQIQVQETDPFCYFRIQRIPVVAVIDHQHSSPIDHLPLGNLSSTPLGEQDFNVLRGDADGLGGRYLIEVDQSHFRIVDHLFSEYTTHFAAQIFQGKFATGVTFNPRNCLRMGWRTGHDRITGEQG